MNTKMDIELDELLEEMRSTLESIGCEVRIGNFGDSFWFTDKLTIVPKYKITISGITCMQMKLSPNNLIKSISNTIKIFEKDKTKIALQGSICTDKDSILIEYGFENVEPEEELPQDEKEFDKKELSFTDNIIESLKVDALSLTEKLKNSGFNQGDFKFLVNNLKTTMELIQELEGKQSPTTINISTVTMENVGNAEDFIANLKNYANKYTLR